MITVTIRFGSQACARTFSEGTTIGSVVRDSSVKAELGYGDSLRCLVNGVEQNESAFAPNAGTVVVETRANSKAN